MISYVKFDMQSRVYVIHDIIIRCDGIRHMIKTYNNTKLYGVFLNFFFFPFFKQKKH